MSRPDSAGGPLLASRLARRSSWLVATVALALGALAPAGAAETAVTAQALADNGEFLPYAPAPAQPAGLCLVDTGVNPNPDTEGVVAERMAIDGGSGEDVSATTHGTVLAMMAAAPVNGWGMVGAAPRSLRIVSVRVLEADKASFTFSDYAAGITACLRVRDHDDLRVINLSLGSAQSPSSADHEDLANAIERATNYGVAVVAAAGNDDGGSVEYPAAYPSVLSVAASDTQGGGFCSFSNRGVGLRLLAPGCGLDGADPASGSANFNYWQGTSESAVIAAASLTALESYRPDLSPAGAEQLLTGANGSVLDVAETFDNAGLGAIVAAGQAAEPSPTPPPSEEKSPASVAPSRVMTLTASYARPMARLKRIGRRIVLVLSGKPAGAQTEVRYLGHRHHSRQLRLLRSLQGSFVQLTLPRFGVTAVSLRYVDAYDAARASPWVMLKVPMTRRKLDRRRR